jgi:hypothetical protein
MGAEGGVGGQGAEMTQTMYKHVEKGIKKKENIFSSREVDFLFILLHLCFNLALTCT